MVRHYLKLPSPVLLTCRPLVTHLHRLELVCYCTIASTADATAVNLRALIQHSLDQLDRLHVRVLHCIKLLVSTSTLMKDHHAIQRPRKTTAVSD